MILELAAFLVAFFAPPVEITTTRGPDTAVIEVAVPTGLHLQANPAANRLLTATTLEVRPGAGATVESIEYPESLTIYPDFAPEGLPVYEGKFPIKLRLSGDTGVRRMEAVLHYQPCDSKACFQPASIAFDFEARLTGRRSAAESSAPLDDSRSPSAIVASRAAPALSILGYPIDESSRWSLIAFAALFVVGCALNATPCVYPIIPVTIGYFGAQASARGRAAREPAGHGHPDARHRAMLVAVYGLSLAIVFSALGVTAAMTGAFLGEAMTSPLVLLAIAGLFVSLALWSFGLFEIRVPFASRIGAKGGILGAAFMGATAGIVAAPCIGPVVAGLLVLVAETGDVLFGFAAFGVLGLGIAFPLSLMGAMAASVDSLPRPGEWMVWIKKVFGVLLLLGAVYPLLPLVGVRSGRLLAAVILAVAGYMIGIRDRTTGGRAFTAVKVATAALMLVSSAILATTSTESEANFIEFTVEEFTASTRPRIVDVYATWCLPCVEMDFRTFSDPAVIERLSGYELYRIDITTRPPRPITEWLSRRKIVGVPSVLFFDTAGREREELRLLGFEPPGQFARRLDEAAR